MHLWLGLLALAATPPSARAYVPALPVNDSTVIPSSSLTVKWVNPQGLQGVYGNSKV